MILIASACGGALVACPAAVAQEAAQASSSAPATQPGASAPEIASSQPAESSRAAPPPPKTPRSPLHFEELTLDAGFEADWQHRQVQTDVPRNGLSFPYRDRQTDTTRRFEETIGLRGSGDVVDEKFLRYQFDLRGGLSQEANRESRPGPDLRQDTHGDLFQYDARATLFPAGRLSANVFALNQDDRVPRMFLPSLDRRRERYGSELNFNDRVLPMRLSYEDEYEELRSYDRSLDDDERHNDRRLEYEVTWQPTDYHHLRLNYEYDDRREEYSGADSRFDTTRNYLTLDHALQFGDDHKSRLDTIARFQDESGDLARDQYEFAPQLRLQHNDQLSSTYRFQYLNEEYEGSTLELFRGDVGLNYRPSEWLDTGVALYGLTQDLERGADTDEWGGTATANYSRENSLGRFTSGLTYNHAGQQSDGDRQDGVVINEAITFRDPLPTYLAHTDVRLFSILVTDAGRTKTYLPGQDYYILQVGRYTWLVRILTGRITDGQTVMVSYLYRTSQDVSLTRDRADFRVQQAFSNGWTPYYAMSLQGEDVDGDRFISYQERNVNRHRVGVDYRQKRWVAGGEFEYNDDGIDPYKGLHLRGDATMLDEAPHNLNVRANFSFLRFDGQDELDPRDTSMLDLGLSYRFLLEPLWDLHATAAYRYEDDSLFGITHGVDLRAGHDWQIGLFTASIEVEYDLLDLPRSSDGTFAVWFKVRRDIPVIARRN